MRDVSEVCKTKFFTDDDGFTLPFYEDLNYHKVVCETAHYYSLKGLVHIVLHIMLAKWWNFYQSFGEILNFLV